MVLELQEVVTLMYTMHIEPSDTLAIGLWRMLLKISGQLAQTFSIAVGISSETDFNVKAYVSTVVKKHPLNYLLMEVEPYPTTTYTMLWLRALPIG